MALLFPAFSQLGNVSVVAPPKQNVGSGERAVSAVAGAAVAGYGLYRRDLPGLLLSLAGALLVYRGISGRCECYRNLGINTAQGTGHGVPAEIGTRAEHAVEIRRPAMELYHFWHHLPNLPSIMPHLRSVSVEGARSHWTVEGPAGLVVQWDAEFINEVPGELIAWQSLPGSQIQNAGSVRFDPVGDGDSTHLKVTLEYLPPAGKIGNLVAKLFGARLNSNSPLTSAGSRWPWKPLSRPWRLHVPVSFEQSQMKAAIFDIDGTLVDSVDLHAKAWQEAFAHFGHDVPFDSLRSQIGKGGDQLMPVFLSGNDIKSKGEDLEKFRGDLFRRKYMPGVKAFPLVRELFQRLLHDGWKLGLASSAKGKDLQTYKEIAAIDDLLDAETSSDDAEKSKPHPDIFQAAMKRLGGIAPKDCIVVGDSPYDAEASVKAGIRPIGFLCGGFPDSDLRNAGCQALYTGPGDLLAKYETSVFHTAKSAPFPER